MSKGKWLKKETERVRKCRDCGKNIDLRRSFETDRFSRRTLCPACLLLYFQGKAYTASKPIGGQDMATDTARSGGRPRALVPLVRLQELDAQGLGYWAIATTLTREGYPVSPSTVSRRLKGGGI